MDNAPQNRATCKFCGVALHAYIGRGKPREHCGNQCRDKYYYHNGGANKQLASREAKKAWMDEQKGGPCADCGIKYPAFVMDFHHVGDKEKAFTISKSGTNASWERLKKEVAKCVVLCSNCHRMRTFAPPIKKGLQSSISEGA